MAPLPLPHAPPSQRPCHTLPTPSSPSPKPCPRGRPGGAVGRGPHPRTDRRRRMRTSSAARASASGSRIRRFSFRRACEWNLARQTRGGQGRGPGTRGQRGEGARSPPHTHNRPVRDVVLAQHGGQLSVRQDRVVVHGGRWGAGGGPGLATRAELPLPQSTAGAARASRERQHSRHACVTLASRPRALRTARAVRGGARPRGAAPVARSGCGSRRGGPDEAPTSQTGGTG